MTNGQGNLPEPSALDLESLGYLNGNATGLPVTFSNPDNTDFKIRFAMYLAAVQAASWGTTEKGPNSRHLGLDKLLVLLRKYWQEHELAYMCQQGSLSGGQVTTRHMWFDLRTGDIAYTDVQVGATPPSNEVLTEIGMANQAGQIENVKAGVPKAYVKNVMAPSPQEDGKFRTYANRRSLLMVHGIWPDEDNDGLTRAELRALTAEAKGQANGSNRGSGTRKGNGSKAKQAKASNGAKAPQGQANGSQSNGSKASNGAKAPQAKVKPIDVLLAEDDGSSPGRADLLRAMQGQGVTDADGAIEMTKELCSQQGVAYPPSCEQDPDVFVKLVDALTGAPA